VAKLKRSRIPDLGRPEITELEVGRKTHKVAEVEPLDVDGVRTMTIGTILWGIAAVALIPFWGTLQENGRTWWLWAAIAGFGLGLMGIEYCRRRRDAVDEASASGEGAVAKAESLKPTEPKVKVPKVKVPNPKVSLPKKQPAPAPEPDPEPSPTVGRRRKN